MSNAFGRLAASAVRRPRSVIAGALALTLLGAFGATRLEPDAATEAFVDRGSPTFEATERFKQKFGDDPVVILVEGELENLLLTDNLGRLLTLEGCLSGRVPPGQQPTNETCRRIAELDPTQAVFGPATFLNQSAIRAEELLRAQSQAAVQAAREAADAAAREARKDGLSPEEQTAAARAAGQEVLAQFQQQVLNLAIEYGQTGPPRVDDPRYVSSVVFDTRFAGGVPKEKFSLLFPSPRAAQILVQLRPGLSESERTEALALFRRAVGERDFRLTDGDYVVSGIPTVVAGLTSELEGETVVLLAVALVVMALTLTAVFGPPMRLLPLAIALIATAIAFGVLALFGGSLTPAALGVLPVVIGLAVDYAIQLQSRFREAVEARPAERAAAAARAASRGGPVIATALLATAAGFVVLLLSPIAMVRTLGLLLVLGVALAFAAALTVGLATLTLGPVARSRAGRRPAARAGRIERARAAAGARLRTFGQRTLAAGITAPGRVIAVAVVLSVAGWIASTQTDVESDVRELVPGSLPALEDVGALEEATGVSGQVNVAVEAPDLTDPALIEWMAAFEDRVLESHGFGGEFPSCERADICPAVPFADLFGGGDLTRSQIRSVLAALPPYFLQAVVAPDSPQALATSGEVPGTANVGFQIPVMPLDEQKQLIDDIRGQIDPPGSEDPPPGVEAEVVGTAVLASDASSTLSSNRYLLTLAALLAVAATLIAVRRSLARALVPLIPIVLATGWSGLVIQGMDIDLNPISAALGALIIAVSTEFSVLLEARYREERASGRSIGESLRRTYERTGLAVLASGLTAIAGFAVLPLAAPLEAIFGGDAIPMLTDFGLVTVVDLAVALLGVMLVLPAALVWSEGGFEPLAEPAARLGRRVGALIPARLRPGSR